MMIQREDILSINFLKKTEYTGCHRGLRYRLEGISAEAAAADAEKSGIALPENAEKLLKTTVWPEPFNYQCTPEEKKRYAFFSFDEDGVVDAVGWMNDRLFDMLNEK